MKLSRQEKNLMREGNRYSRLADQAEARGNLDDAIRFNRRAMAAYTAAERAGDEREAA